MDRRRRKESGRAAGEALAAFALVFSAGAACAQAAGNVDHGRGVAERVCSECHAVGAGETLSPHPQAPSFAAVANAPGRTATSLRVWFQSPHRSMPDIGIAETDSEDLIAYILSLKRRS